MGGWVQSVICMVFYVVTKGYFDAHATIPKAYTLDIAHLLHSPPLNRNVLVSFRVHHVRHPNSERPPTLGSLPKGSPISSIPKEGRPQLCHLGIELSTSVCLCDPASENSTESTGWQRTRLRTTVTKGVF